jgi:hypothetical protein
LVPAKDDHGIGTLIFKTCTPQVTAISHGLPLNEGHLPLTLVEEIAKVSSRAIGAPKADHDIGSNLTEPSRKMGSARENGHESRHDDLTLPSRKLKNLCGQTLLLRCLETDFVTTALL